MITRVFTKFDSIVKVEQNKKRAILTTVGVKMRITPKYYEELQDFLYSLIAKEYIEK